MQEIINNQNIAGLGDFINSRKQEIMMLAQKNTEEVVNEELALIDFELLMAANLTEKEAQKLTIDGRELREEGWNELSKKFNGDYKKIHAFLKDY